MEQIDPWGVRPEGSVIEEDVEEMGVQITLKDAYVRRLRSRIVTLLGENAALQAQLAEAQAESEEEAEADPLPLEIVGARTPRPAARRRR